MPPTYHCDKGDLEDTGGPGPTKVLTPDSEGAACSNPGPQQGAKTFEGLEGWGGGGGRSAFWFPAGGGGGSP